jgi:hypothetical protein
MSGNSQAPEQRAAAKKKKGGYTVSPNMMKLITLMTLLISDADVLFTITSVYAYVTNPGGPLIIMTVSVGLFTLVYIGGCIIAARESGLFVMRFREQVRLNEIAGLDLEEMDLFFKGKPVRISEQRSLDSVEQEFHDKAEGKAARPNRAQRDGQSVDRSSAHDGPEPDEEAQRPGKRQTHAKLAPTEKEARKKYNEDPERALYLLCQHKDITFAFFRERCVPSVDST